MNKAFKLIQGRHPTPPTRRGYDTRVAGVGPPPHPILSPAEFAGVRGFPASASQQPRMDFAN